MISKNHYKMENKTNLIKILFLNVVLLLNKPVHADNFNNNKRLEETETKMAESTKTNPMNKGMVALLFNGYENHVSKGIDHMTDSNRSNKENYPSHASLEKMDKVTNKKEEELNELVKLINENNESEYPQINQKRNTAKRSVEETVSNSNVTFETNLTKGKGEEECIGAEEYCNMTREEYVEMLNNYIYPHTFEWVLIATYTLVFIGGLVGNALVCVAVYRNRSMRTVTNYFIVNLAIADFMVILFCLPPTLLWDVTETWFFGDAMCKIILYFQSVSVTVSVLTLTFISVDRWYAICFPLKFKSTTSRAKIAILVIWAVSLTLNAPELVVLTTEQTVPLRFDLKYLVQCVANWSQQSDLIWHIIKIVFIYTVPLMLMTLAHYHIVKVLWRSDKIPGQADTAKLAPAEQCQLRSRRKAAKMLAAVVIMFGVCYFPVHLLSMIRYSQELAQTDVVTFLALISHVLCYANSAVNPLIYNFMSGKFRREFRRAFCCSISPVAEHSSTLTRLTTVKKSCELVTLDSRRSRDGYNYKTTLF